MNFSPRKILLRGKSPQKCIYILYQPRRRPYIVSPSSDIAAVREPRHETCWNLPQYPSKLTNWSQPLLGRSSPYCEDMWRRHCCLTSFFPTADICLSCEDTAWQSCATMRRWQIFYEFLHPAFPACRVQHISDLHSKFALRPHHVWKYGRHPILVHWTPLGVLLYLAQTIWMNNIRVTADCLFRTICR